MYNCSIPNICWVYCINRTGGQLLLQGKCTGKRELEVLSPRLNSWLILLTLHVKALPDLPEASGVQAPLSRFPGAVHGTDNEVRAPAGKEPLENFDQDSFTVSSDTLACFFLSPICFEHLSEGWVRGQLAGWLLAPWRHCAVPKAPTADTAQGNQLLRTRPVPSALPRPTCCLSWADPPGSSCLL